MLSGTVQGLIASLNGLTEEELEALKTAVSAELMERDLNGRENGAVGQAEGLGDRPGSSSQAPACQSKIRANERGVNPGWDWQTIRVACGECRGTGWRKTLWDGVPYECKSCEGRGWLELTVPVLRAPECGGPADERVMAGMRCGRCAYGGR